MVLMMTSGTIFLPSCSTTSTVTPDPVHNKTHAPDSSVPKGVSTYDGWLLWSLKDESGKRIGAVITENARDRYNALVEAYQIQFFDAFKVKIFRDAGIKPFTEYDMNVWQIDAEHLVYFRRLSRWSKIGMEPDDRAQKKNNRLG